MAPEKLQMTVNRVGEPSGGEAIGFGRNGFHASDPSGQRVSTQRSQPTCLVVEDDHISLPKEGRPAYEGIVSGQGVHLAEHLSLGTACSRRPTLTS